VTLAYSSQTDSMYGSPSYHGENLFNFDGQMLDRLLLQIRPITENRHSTGIDPADMPRHSAASYNIG